MKKSIFVLVALFLGLTSMAQEHLSFKGISIEGSMESFCEKLADKGFTELGNDGNTTLFTGDFTGRNATVGVISDDDGENVYSVVVLFDSSGEWNVLVSTYKYYKDLYTRKYGKPTKTIEKNSELMSMNPSNTGLMAEVHQGRVTWGSLWSITGGEIEISIEKTSGIYEGAVVIRYRDAQNEEAKIQKHLEDI